MTDRTGLARCREELASLRPAHIDGGFWFTVIALFIATIVVWLMLKRRHGT